MGGVREISTVAIFISFGCVKTCVGLLRAPTVYAERDCPEHGRALEGQQHVLFPGGGFKKNMY